MRKALYAALLAAALLPVLPRDAWAVFQLTVSPRHGGQSLHFEGAQPGETLRNEEVTITVSTDRAAQYRLLQTVYQPLTNELGNTLPAGAFILFSPSNPLGTLRTQLETPVTMGQSQIYVSNAAGDADEFVLIYSVRIPEEQPGGIYRTQLTFTAEPVNMQAGVSPSITTLEVRVEITPKFRLDIVSDKGTRTLDLGRVTKDRRVGEGALLFHITSNVGSSFRLYQQLSEPPTSSEGGVLDAKALVFTPDVSRQGTVSAGANSPLDSTQSLVYTSGDYGASDELRLVYSISPQAVQKAGVYRGNLSFHVESSSSFVPREVINVPVTIEIEPIFSLETSFEQAGGISFGAFKEGGRQERRATLKVLSNLGEPYQVTQVVPRALSADDGTAMPEGAFRFFIDRPSSGQVKAPEPQPVVSGESLLFISDSKGTPEEITAHYVLEPPEQAKAGSYSSEIKYTITTL